MGLLYGENCMILTLTVFAWITRVTDRRTDRRTDGRTELRCRAQKPLPHIPCVSSLVFILSATAAWFLVKCFSAGSDGALTRWPESSTLIPGTLLRLNCGTDQKAPVLWTFTAEGSTRNIDMTGLGVLLPSFSPYFYIDPSSKYDLVARTSNANESYCGTYTCRQNIADHAGRTAIVASKCAVRL